jgi:phenylalanyl-tRNA synthetase beta chain
MKFSEQWLREWVSPDVSTEVLSHQLTMCGLEVDAIEPVAAPFSNVVIGEVVSVEPHPDADRLRVCRVNVGSEQLTIVCGAANVAQGLKVPAALIGAVLPNGLAIKKSKLRGVESFGMLCSAVELGLAESADGLMILPADATPGVSVRDYLQLDDVTIEIGLTPNRGDCLSIQGIAREVGVINQIVITEPEIASVLIKRQDHFPVTLSAPDACPRYIGRIIKGVNPKAETPEWMKERLRRCDLRSISPIVDVTNYVMLELGQPMHAFDLSKLEGGIKVRYAEAGESLKLLDGQSVELTSDTLVIADHSKPLAMAGIMGGDESAVSDDTTDIFLESAFFAPTAILGRARQYGLHTDSSHRFERGVDYELPVKAMKRATALLQEIVGGEAGQVIEANVAEHLPVRQPISLRVDRIKRVLGLELPQPQITEMLESLGMKVREQGKQWIVTPPSFRFDLAIESDLIEEVGRVYGYDHLPTELPKITMEVKLPTELQVSQARGRELLVDRGYQEAITYSFVDEQLQQLITPGIKPITLANPISADMSAMRTSLWPGLLQALSHNQKRQQARVRLFEFGVKFSRQQSGIVEEKIISGVLAGDCFAEQWAAPGRKVDFYDIKADLQALLGLTGRGVDYIFVAEPHPALHPGQSAAIKSHDGKPIGWVGKLHPVVEKELGLNGPIYLFEIDAHVLDVASKPVFTELSKYPSIRRDLAIVVNKGAPAREVEQCIAAASGQYLANLQLFDVYGGEGIESGRKSLALGLTFQDASRTLTDQEVDDLISDVLKQLKQEFNATLRE